MTARISLKLGRTGGHRPPLQSEHFLPLGKASWNPFGGRQKRRKPRSPRHSIGKLAAPFSNMRAAPRKGGSRRVLRMRVRIGKPETRIRGAHNGTEVVAPERLSAEGHVWLQKRLAIPSLLLILITVFLYRNILEARPAIPFDL